MKISTRLILKVLGHGWAIKETFYSRSPKMTFNAFFFKKKKKIFYSKWKNIRFPSYTIRRLFKRIALKNCAKKSFESKLRGIPYTCRKKLSLLP